MAASLLPDPLGFARRALVRQVQDVFNDRTRGEAPVIRSDRALYPPGSVIWRVHGDVTTMMIGGVAALLLQMLHPAALTGVWEHSAFRNDMIGRLRRTARFIAVTTYGERGQADAAIAKVRAIHERVRGVLPDGTSYAASDPALLAWIHVCEAICFLEAWVRYAEPAMTAADRDRYMAEAAQVARSLGADPVPETVAEAQAIIADFRPYLAVDHRTRVVARLILSTGKDGSAAAAARNLVSQAAIDLLPRWARSLHHLDVPRPARPVVRGGAAAMARTLRWAFGQRRPGTQP